MTTSKPPSSTKAKGKMKYKYQGVYLPTVVVSKVEEIKDTEVGHQDLVDFVKQTEMKPLPDPMRAIVHSNLHLVAMFPTTAHNTKFFLQVASHYIRESRSVIDSLGHEILRLNLDFFDIVFKVPQMEKDIDISIQKAQEVFDAYPKKAKNLINTQWLKKPRQSVSRWPKGLL